LLVIFGGGSDEDFERQKQKYIDALAHLESVTKTEIVLQIKKFWTNNKKLFFLVIIQLINS